MENSEIKNYLKQYGIKSSEKKIKLLSKILKEKGSFDAQSLYEKIKDEMDRATVYRTLTQFKEKRVIRETINVGGKQFYENRMRTEHPHFVCVECNEVECLEDLDINLSLDLLDRTIENISINITGICQRCSI